MLKRFLKLKDVLVTLNHPEVNEHLPYGRKVNSLEALEKNLKVFESVTKALQDPSINLAQVRLLFEKISAKYPTLERRLRTDAALVFCKDFENGIAVQPFTILALDLMNLTFNSKLIFPSLIIVGQIVSRRA